MAPSSRARTNSSAGVSFEVNMIASPRSPAAAASSSSASEEQSAPAPSRASSLTMYGFGVAFTAKYSRKPGHHENAAFMRRRFATIAASS